MVVALFVIGIILFTFGNISQNIFANSVKTSKTAPLLFAFSWFTIVAVFFGGYLLFTKSLFFDGRTVLIAIIAGLCFSAGASTALNALRKGPLSLTILIISFDVVIPTVLSFIFLKEQLAITQITGFILILIVFVIINTGKDEKREFKLSWLFISLLCCFVNGVQMFMAKLHQNLLPGQQVMEYFFIAFLAASLSSLIFYLIHRGRDDEQYKYTKKYFYLPVLETAVSLGGANLIVLMLSPLVISAVLFPTLHGSALLITAVISITIFKEKPNIYTYLSLFLGLIAIVLLNI